MKKPFKFSSKLKIKTQEILINAFVAKETVAEAAKVAKVNKDSAHLYFTKLRAMIETKCKEKHVGYEGEWHLPKYFYSSTKNGFKTWANSQENPKGETENNVHRPAIGIRVINRQVKAFLLSEYKKTPCIKNQNISGKVSKEINIQIDAIIYMVSGETESRIKNKNAKRYQLVISSKINIDSLKGDLIKKFFEILKGRLYKANGTKPSSLGGYIKECEWRANTPQSFWAYELTLLAKSYICPKLEVGEEPILSLGDVPMLGREIDKMIERDKSA